MFVYHASYRLLLSLCASCAVLTFAPVVLWAQDPKSQASAASDGSAKAPRIRFVISSQAEVLAGPGADFYPTTILKSGQSIEVHQESDDGWLAISPPNGSFSWLPAAQGLLLPGGRVVEVTEKSAVSWIGTELGTAKQYRWQVKLERGQQLAVLGEQTIADSASGSKALWYKVAPPPGEVRWIQARATSDQAPMTEKAISSVASAVGPVTDADAVDKSEVVQASGQQSLASGGSQRPPAKPRVRQAVPQAMPQQHSDRWSQWHAVEFKNGTFSFPGLARMMGIPPTDPVTAAAPSDDPFDLTASYMRPKSTQRAAPQTPLSPMTEPLGMDSLDSTTPGSTTMAVRQSRGWRDPRQLRDERMRGSMDGERIDETALAVNEPDMNDADVMDAGFEGDVEIGTGVVTAAAESRSPPPMNQEQAWYGIDQAPTSQPAKPLAVAQAGLDEVQLELSAMVAGPEHTWNLAPLAERARYFVEHGQNSLQRGQARLLLERIESFSTIAQRSSALGMATPNVAPGRAIPASATTGLPTRPASVPSSTASWVAPSSNGANGSAAESSGAKFDATGWLVPVHSSGRDMPTHALTNDAGRIIVYVTPAPGVNLTRFESQPIGVYGLRGYLPQLKSNHIQIQRVVRLQ